MTLTKCIDFKTYRELNDLEKTKVDRVVSLFEKSTGLSVKYVIRAPGRVNLIGDHIDYHGFSVLPMAIENAILVCVSTLDALQETLLKLTDIKESSVQTSQKSRVVILNSDQDLYPPYCCEHSFSHGSELDQAHKWYHYVLCGYHGVMAKELLQLNSSQIFDHAKSLNVKERSLDDSIQSGDQSLRHFDKLDNMIVYVDSDLPPASGLSSSSALVCASALATHLVLLEHKRKETPQVSIPLSIPCEPLAEDCAKFEHLVGTHGGGMDQAVILTAQVNYAKHITFRPKFQCSNVLLPESVVWLVSHCGENYPKAATFGFNSRVLETKLAAALIIKRLKPQSSIPLDQTITLSKVMEELNGLDSSGEEFLAVIWKEIFREATELSFEEVSTQLDMSRSLLIKRFNTSEDFLTKSGLNSRLCLYKRSKHILLESDRVKMFRAVCESSGDPKLLGKLMNDSHSSLKHDYECSHPALDKLVDVSLEAGALGARLTGAGWGGCIVSLVESDRAEQVLEELKKVSRFTFRTEPQSGASIIQVS